MIKDPQQHEKKKEIDGSTNIRTILNATNSPRPLHPKIEIGRELAINEMEQPNSRTKNTTSVYMLSQLLEDLDNLCSDQEPCIEKKLDEISEALSSFDETKECDVDPETDHGTLPLLKSSDFDWSFQRIEHTDIAAVEEESDESDISDADDDSNM